MTKDGKILTCIVADTMRNIIKQANELSIEREDIVSITTLHNQIYLMYYTKD